MVKKKKKKVKLSLDKQIKKIKISIKKIEEKKETSDIIKKHSILSKKLKKCNDQVEYYERVISNKNNYSNKELSIELGNLLKNIDDFNIENNEDNDLIFNKYIEELKSNKKILENDSISFESMIIKYIESKTLIDWCKKYIESQKINWNIID
tara:strand:+ start:1209 stop:1664 length:456 start_codon:yes stop_codon:yes gene_type:complete